MPSKSSASKSFLKARDQVRGEFAIIPRVSLKSDEAVMLDGMHFSELQANFNLPAYAFDFARLAAAIESGSVEPIALTKAA